MPFQIVRNDIVNMQVDAIVNTANPRPVIGAGTDAGIHKKAGPELLEARKKIGDIPVGSAVITPGFCLDSKYVIHTVGPVWRGGQDGEAEKLRCCYDNSLKLAAEHGCRSIAFPLISSGTYGFPKGKALQIAIAAFSEFLPEHEMDIYMVVFDRDAFTLSEKLFQSVESYIDENYVAEKELQERASPRNWGFSRELREVEYQRRRTEEFQVCSAPAPCPAPCAPLSLDDLMKQTDAGFSETLLKLIDKTGKKDSEIYKKAMISKQHFSKIRNNPDYKPTKSTAIALALALELDLEGTKDLIGRAGYALTKSSKADLIISYYIERGMYNVVEIDCVLFQYDQPLLGS